MNKTEANLIVQKVSLCSASVGSRVKFEEEKQSYIIQAKSDKFVVLNKPFNLRKTVLYCIIDIEKWIRGPENLLFGAGAETQEQCEAMLQRLHGNKEYCDFQTEVSYRNNIPVKIEKIIHGNKSCQDITKD